MAPLRKRRFFPWMALIFLLLIFPILRAAPLPGADSQGAETDLAKKHWKILHIMSYHSPWKWTDGQFDGLKLRAEGPEHRIQSLSAGYEKKD